MTTLLAQLRADSLTARKARETDKALFLTTLLADAARKGKDAGTGDSTDDQVVGVLKTYVDNTTDTIRRLGDKAPEQRARLEAELAILQGYMPAQASPEAVDALIAETVSGLMEKGPKQIGVVMAALTAKFGANFDKAAASKAVRAALTA